MDREYRFSSFQATVLTLLLLAGGSVVAQTTGDLTGKVAGRSGAPLPGATLEATGPSLQGTRTAVSRADGAYWIPAVPPGNYTVTATMPGFKRAEKKATVTLDSTETVDFALELVREEAVVVTGEAPQVDTTSTTTGTNYPTKVIVHLPVGRNYADIVRSNPGVNTDRGETQGRSLALTVYGATSVENQWVIDGVNTTNVVKGSQGKTINSEFVQEVEIKTGGYQAEYGRAMGGVINVITKSGGNELHGDVFGYYDSMATSATPLVTASDQIDTSMRIAGYERQDVGVDVGGFILKDRLWFFGAYDRVRTPGQVARYTSVPLVPNTMEFPLDAIDNLYSAKLTWNITSGTTLVATAFADPTTNSGAGAADPRQGRFTIRPILNPDPGTWQADRNIGGTDFGLRLNHLQGASALVTLQGSRHQEKYELTTVGAGAAVRLEDWTCEGGTPANPCEVPSVANSVTGGFGPVYGPTNHNESHRDQLRGDLTLYLGGHEVKAGGDYQNAVTKAVYSYSGGQAVYRNNLYGQLFYVHDFYAVSPTDLTPVDGPVGPRTRDYGAFLQDTWRVSPGWTVSAGLRWDGEDVRDYNGDTVIKTTLWQPRLGVVWDPKKDGSSKVYVFAGRFGYALPTDLSVRSYGNLTFAETYNFDPVNVAQDPNVIGFSRPYISGGAFSEPVDSNLNAIYQDELTFGVEKLLGPSFSVGIKATYRRLGEAIEDRCDLDGSRPETGYNYCAIFNPGSSQPIASGALPGCNGLNGDFYACSDTSAAMGPARRLYRGIEILARKSFSDKLWLQASYVFSSLRGNYDGEVNASGQTDPGINTDFDYPALLHNNYGRLFLDRPHSFRLDGFYTLPFGLSVGLQAWARSGAPLNRLGYFANCDPSSCGYGINLDPKGYAGREPTNWDANLTVGYPFRLGPVTVTLQAFLYNLFNNQLPTSQNVAWTRQPPPDYPASLYDPNQPQNNPDYGKIQTRQDPRMFRAAVRISF